MGPTNASEVVSACEQERRAEQRFPLRLPIHIKCFGNFIEEASSFTHDISARGAYFPLDFELCAGTSIEMLLILPPEITLSGEVRVRCRGRVVRVSKSSSSPTSGIAAIIEHYDFTEVK